MEKEEDRKVKIEKELEAKDQGEEDCCEIDLVEFSRKLSIKISSDADEDEEDEEVVILGTKGPVALRDFPHPRHLCANFPFESTPHESYCSQCYCASCEVVAPCSNWEGSDDAHCNIIRKKCSEKTETVISPEKKLF